MNCVLAYVLNEDIHINHKVSVQLSKVNILRTDPGPSQTQETIEANPAFAALCMSCTSPLTAASWCHLYSYFWLCDDVQYSPYSPDDSPLPSFLSPLPLRPTSSWTAVTTISASPTSSSPPPCKTDTTLRPPDP